MTRPDIQTIAQAELDSVTRRERLPTLGDRPTLPFVNAVCKEVIRWRPVLPLGGLLSGNRRHKRYDGSQVFPMQRQKMMSITVSSSPKVGILRGYKSASPLADPYF